MVARLFKWAGGSCLRREGAIKKKQRSRLINDDERPVVGSKRAVKRPRGELHT